VTSSVPIPPRERKTLAMTFDTLIKNGVIATATDTYPSDVGISEGRIVALAQTLPADSARQVLDAAGRYLLPGGIDVHTHLDMPFGGTTSADDFESGTIAAAFGGTTTLVDFAIQYRGQTLRTALDTWWKKAEGKAAIDYSFHCIVTDLPDARLEEMKAVAREGITSFKLFMAYPGVFMVDDALIFKAMMAAAETGSMVCMHAENGGAIDVLVKRALAEGKTAPKYHALTRPTTAEAEAVGRAVALAEMAGAPVYIVHLSCNDALEKVREARDRGLPVYAETCPQYLFLSIENFDAPGFEGAKYVFTPPLREKWHQEKLWAGLAADRLQVVSTDHCPFCYKEQKELGKDDFTKIPNGGPGIEHRLSLVYTGGVHGGRFSVNRFVEMISTTPAKLFGLYPRKGTIAVGSDADLVIFDPNEERVISAGTHHMRVDYSMFEGIRIKGVPRQVLSRGRLVIDGDNFVGRAGHGEFLKRQPFGTRV
jgi:dihydropyrimidinase